MKLSQLLSIRHILPNLQTMDRWQAIEALLDHLIEIGDVQGAWRAEILASLRQREDMISTGVGAGVAIPHAFSEHISEVIAVFARSREGVDFAAQDGMPAHFVVLFISPRHSYHKHLHALAAIARMFTRPETRDKLMLAENAETLHALFQMKNVDLSRD